MRLPACAPRPLGLLLGYAADLAFGDPRGATRWPASAPSTAPWKSRLYADNRGRGVLHVGTLVGGTVILTAAADRTVKEHPVLRTVLTAAVTWAVLGGRSLRTEATRVRRPP